MTLIYILTGIGVLIGLAGLCVYIHRSALAKGKLEANNDCDKRVLKIKSELAKKIYGSIDNINAGMDIRMPDPTVRIKDTKTPI